MTDRCTFPLRDPSLSIVLRSPLRPCSASHPPRPPRSTGRLWEKSRSDRHCGAGRVRWDSLGRGRGRCVCCRRIQVGWPYSQAKRRTIIMTYLGGTGKRNGGRQPGCLLCSRIAHLRKCSLDARSWRQPGHLPREGIRTPKKSPQRPGEDTFTRSFRAGCTASRRLDLQEPDWDLSLAGDPRPDDLTFLADRDLQDSF